MEYVAIASVLIAGTYTAVQQRRAGQFQEIQYKEQAQAEEDAARDREVNRRQRLVEALASQNAEGGALGALPGFGSRAAQTLEDVRRANLDSLTDRAITGRRALVLRQSGRFARSAANAQSYGTILSTVSDAASMYSGGASGAGG